MFFPREFSKESIKKLKLAGDVSHVLNISILEALDLPLPKLQILYNEAVRQRIIDAINLRLINADEKAVEDTLAELKLIHGDYTEGFYEEQLKAAQRYFGVMKRGKRQADTKNSNQS